MSTSIAEAHPQEAPNTRSFVYRTVADKDLEMKLWYPPNWKEGGPKLPASVMIFGGGWYAGDIAQFNGVAPYLANRGLIVITPEYRTTKNGGVEPKQCLEDAKSAMRYIYSHANELGVDTKKISAGGRSAGGHLAAAVTFCKGFNAEGDNTDVPTGASALILFNPVIDNGPGGFRHEHVKAYWKDFSPLHNISNNPPPTIFLTGDKDQYTPIETAEKYKAEMEKKGGRCDLVVFKDGVHGSPFHPAHYPTTLQTMDDFLVSVGHLKPKTPRIESYKQVGDVELKMHIFEPASSDAKRPAIVFFFGGGWVSGSPSQFYPHARHLASKGMVAMCAEYRIKKKHGTSPYECVKDGKSAVRWIRTNAERLRIDPERIAAGGGSAGGHVAAATGTVSGFDDEDSDSISTSSRPDALVLFNPVYDNGPDGGWGHKKVEENWKSFSPANNIDAKTPPTIVFLGTKDKLIPASTAQRFRDRMKQAGVRSELKLYERAGHGFFNERRDGGKFYRQTVAEMDRFLKELGFIK